jgi:hypothetical protein
MDDHLKPFASSPESIGDIAARFSIPIQQARKGIHSPLHDLVDDLRRDFGETAKTGKGSFGFYLGILKRLGPERVRQIKAEVDQSEPAAKKRLFWWHVGKALKMQSGATSSSKSESSE